MSMKKTISLLLTAVLVSCTSSIHAAFEPIGTLTAPPPAVPAKQVAFVIDDFGNNMKGTEDILSMPVPLTIAVMPFLPSTQKDAELAHKNGHDVIVHMPMEPIKGKASWLGPGAITSDLTDEEIRSRVNKAIDDVPHAIGMNNHMGSKVTADERIMRIVMSVLKERGLFYLDSKTNYKSVAGKMAEELGVPHIDNEMFLDDSHTTEHITKQMEKVCARLGQGPSCIVIGHVGPAGKKTASILRQYIPRIQKEAEFVTISKMVFQSIH
ncbi:divergent polysaccharide deacetylase family protein [Brevibacillus invocatus]|uniref:divergent polysaccharide deacetylase family protein n=1 Tax=Brevibacillus invocatus TaxID=173959 RepID=UPI00203F6A94|nr:divergent polysaccharide deacetylase family protein [Brevibacillus invocatus]MCM3079465.1 divergent polysaccharide deacetylase family protein [Brevibacillus invocatus]MCM3429483.1 divergent polysaccharide deacetylase family protein [Brevibacillus invocatus]